AWYRQEYFCSFEALEGLVFPNFARCVVPALLTPDAERRPGIRRVRGIDFGFRNPFAAVWGFLDQNNVLWVTHEHYGRGKPLSDHLKHLPRDVTWYVDPSGANERSEMRVAGFTVCAGDNTLRPGLAKITARIEAAKL